MANIIETIRKFLSSGKKKQHAATVDTAVQCDLPAPEGQSLQSLHTPPAGTCDTKPVRTGNIDIPPRSSPQAHPWPDNTVPMEGPSPLARRMAREEAIRRGEGVPVVTWEEQWS